MKTTDYYNLGIESGDTIKITDHVELWEVLQLHNDDGTIHLLLEDGQVFEAEFWEIEEIHKVDGSVISIKNIDEVEAHTMNVEGTYRTKKQKKKYIAEYTKLRSIHNNLKQMCTNPKNSRYHNFGAKGVTICADWAGGIHTFIEWSLTNGYIEDKTKLVRYDEIIGFTPDNCTWVFKEEIHKTQQEKEAIARLTTRKIPVKKEEALTITKAEKTKLMRIGWIKELISHGGQSNRIATRSDITF